jgi:competence protein ComEC
MGEALVTVLNPDGGERTNANDESMVLRLDWHGVSLLLTGDLGWEGEERMQGQGAPLRVTMLKVAHHGSRFSSSTPFLDAARPALAIVSAGARNPFRHPAAETLARLEAAGARVYRTDRDGAVIVETDGARLWVTRWASGIGEVFDLDAEPPGAGI